MGFHGDRSLGVSMYVGFHFGGCGEGSNDGGGGSLMIIDEIK